MAEEKNTKTFSGAELKMGSDGLPVIVWYPGHMAKAKRLIADNLKLVDVVIVLLDARIPFSSTNPLLSELIGTKPALMVLNKMDLADPRVTKKWLQFYRTQGKAAVAVDAVNGRGIKELVKQVALMAKAKTEKFVNKGGKARAPRAMVLGIPNVGKSSLINRLAGGSKARAENRPGVTRAKQWIHIENSFDLLDMPGILWPQFEDQTVALHLAFTGAISDEAVDLEPIVARMLLWLRENASKNLATRFKIDGELPNNPEKLLELIGKNRGCLVKGGAIDREKTQRLILREFRAGQIGSFTLDIPPIAEKAVI